MGAEARRSISGLFGSIRADQRGAAGPGATFFHPPGRPADDTSGAWLTGWRALGSIPLSAVTGGSNMNASLTPDDHVIVLFGGTGNLARRKLLPGHFHLAKADLVPAGYRVVGSAPARFALSDDEFRSHAKDAAAEFGIAEPADDAWRAFERSLSFGAADPDDPKPLLRALQAAEKAIGGSSASSSQTAARSSARPRWWPAGPATPRAPTSRASRSRSSTSSPAPSPGLPAAGVRTPARASPTATCSGTWPTTSVSPPPTGPRWPRCTSAAHGRRWSHWPDGVSVATARPGGSRSGSGMGWRRVVSAQLSRQPR